MEDLRPADQVQVQLLKGEPGVRPRLSGEGEAPLSPAVQGDEGQGGEGPCVPADPPGIDPCLGEGAHQHIPKGVRPHLPQKGGAFSVGRQGRQQIPRRAAGVGGHGRVALPIRPVPGKVDQQLPQRGHIQHMPFLLCGMDDAIIPYFPQIVDPRSEKCCREGPPP